MVSHNYLVYVGHDKKYLLTIRAQSNIYTKTMKGMSLPEEFSLQFMYVQLYSILNAVDQFRHTVSLALTFAYS